MREIKFRAWDKISNKFYDQSAISFDILKGTTSETSEFVFQQYTGLKDKKGGEIFEGDILNFVGGTCSILYNGLYNDQFYKVGDTVIVQSLDSGFTIAGTNMIECHIPNRVGKVDNYRFWNHQRSFEVIGNIFENPELIK